jgi:hypothetical protein
MRLRKVVVRVELPGVGAAQARDLVWAALTKLAGTESGEIHGRVNRVRVKVAADSGDRLAQAVAAAIASRARWSA